MSIFYKLASIGDKVRCVDTEGLDLGLISVSQEYQVKAVFKTYPSGRQKYKGFPAIEEPYYVLEGVEGVVKPNGRQEGFMYSFRRFMPV